eukprot:TRINITY_DN3253_c0_g1_i1.p2 TRINITY_DN3253_c0_g1~~TRINITY_DN3253_c0_g1_i1.p2  ORF type:complete len:130 (-),score=29.94 TRINITY_DN3253_c0_g1_i1:205-594(-)
MEDNHSITKLNLCENEIGEIGARTLGKMLKKNDTLLGLDLNNNPLNDQGVEPIIENLKENTRLEILSLWNTGISEISGMVISNFLKEQEEGQMKTRIQKINIANNTIHEATEIQIFNQLMRMSKNRNEK